MVVAWNDLPSDIPKYVSSFLKQSQIAHVARTSTRSKNDVSSVLRQREQRIHQQYQEFFKKMVDTKKKTVQEKDRLLDDWKMIVKTCNPNVFLRNGHTPLYQFIHTCFTHSYLHNKFCERGIHMLIKEGVNVRQDPSLVRFLLLPQYSMLNILPQLCKEGLLIKETDFLPFIKRMSYQQMNSVQNVLGCIFSNLDNGIYPFDFTFRDPQSGDNIITLFTQHCVLNFCQDISDMEKDEWDQQLQLLMRLLSRMNQAR